VDVAAPFGILVGGSLVLVAAALARRQREVIQNALPPAVTGQGSRTARGTRPVERWPLVSGLPLALVAGFLGWLAVGPVGAAAGLVGGPLLLRATRRRRGDRRNELLEDQFRDVVDALAAGVRAGLSVRRALEEAARESEPPLRPILSAAVARLEVGDSLDSVLASLPDRLATPDAPLLVTLVAIHRRAGGNLPAMLDEVASVITQRRQARRDLRALTAQARVSGAVLAVLPIAFVTLLSWTGGDGLGPFYRTPTGSGLLLGGLFLEGLGFLWIRRLLRPRGAT
jgi:tight adherence protein B